MGSRRKSILGERGDVYPIQQATIADGAYERVRRSLNPEVLELSESAGADVVAQASRLSKQRDR